MFHLHEKVMQLQAKLSPHFACTPTVHIRAQTKSVTLCHPVHEVIQIQYPNTDLKNNSPCRCRSPMSMLSFFWLLSEHSSWTKGIQRHLRFDDLKNQTASSYWYFSIPKYRSNVFLTRKVFLLMPHKILDEINALCQKLSPQRCKGSLRRLIVMISSPGHLPHGDCYNQAGSDFYVNESIIRTRCIWFLDDGHIGEIGISISKTSIFFP